jgi:hypothetical protein
MGRDLTVNSIPTDEHLTKIFSPGAGDLYAQIYNAQTLFVALFLPRSIPWVRLF